MGERKPQIILWPRSKPGKSVAQVNACHWPESLNSQYSFTGRHLVTPKHTALSEEASLPNACSMRAHARRRWSLLEHYLHVSPAQPTTSIQPFHFRRYHTISHWRRLRLPEFSLMGTFIFISSSILVELYLISDRFGNVPTAFIFYIMIPFSILWYRFWISPNIKIYHFQLVLQPFSTIFFTL